MRSRATTWRTGGILLGVSGLLGVVGFGFFSIPGGAAVVVDILWAAGVLVFALGLSRAGSVVGRRPLGVTALAVVGIAPLLVNTARDLTPSAGPTATAPFFVSAAFALTAAVLSIAAGAVASVQIARLGAVPRRWRWAPMAALAISVGMALLQQIGYVVVLGAGAGQGPGSALALLGVIGFLAPTLGLGVVALLAAAGERPESVEVFRSR